MRIGQAPPQIADISSIKPTNSVSSTTAISSDRPVAGSAAEVELSVQARLTLQSLPPTRADRVESVRARLQAGTFSVQSDQLADRILSQ